LPTYQYRCTECDHAFEQFQSFTDDALTVCPVCSGRLRKVFNAVGVVFKGSGFYRNDSRGKDASSGGESSGSADSATKEPATKSSGDSDSGSSSTPPDSSSASSSSSSSSTSASGTAAPATT
jgi:putative FmdB family regulatory protein